MTWQGLELSSLGDRMQRTVPAPYPWLVLMAPGAAFTPHPHPRFFHMQRRQILARSAALASLLTPLAPAALAQATAARAAAPAAKAAKVAGTLRIVIPANPGGGWDQTGRALGAALKAVGAADQVEYENIGGKGGTIGLAKYAEKYGSDANTLLMGGMVMVGAVALQKPAVDMGHIQPLARLTSDYLIAAVPAASSIKTGKDLANAMRTDLAALPVAGGSAGGVDHIYAGVLARAGQGQARGAGVPPLCQRTRGGGFAAQRRRSRGPVGLQRIQRRAGLGQAAGCGRIGPAQCLWHPRLQGPGH